MKKVFFITIIVFSAIVISLYVVNHMNEIRFGAADGELPILNVGTYEQGDNLNLKTGTYAIYAQVGKGEVCYEDRTYKLNDSLYTEAKKQPKSTQNAVIYEESPKIAIVKGSQLTLKGDKDFMVSFIKR
ncbi:hypothetical protein E5983_03560 [Streptococcus danieliae]|uniref:Uncharacterized protein n=1 Tax=Streptococcus danieliae TaxID=747656 RepID=A0A7X3G7T3_9STRE|nr:hypothetical protein [Streptococcus danieliae]MVX58726.1 hypothetical protein [Streptococcus danieliae]